MADAEIKGPSNSRYLVALQLLLLALAFLVPGVTGVFLPLLHEEQLQFILTLEFFAIIAGMIVLGFAFPPFFLFPNAYVRWGSMVIVVLLTLPLSAGIRDEYGWPGFFAFGYLIFATYCGALFRSTSEVEKLDLLYEVCLRWVVYMVLFSVLGAMVPTIYIERATNHVEGFYFGASYFGVAAFMEWRCYFSRAVVMAKAMLAGHYKRRPASPRKDKQDRYLSWRPQVNQTLWLSLTGVVLVIITAVFFTVSFEFESWIARIAFWLFLTPFALIGFGMSVAAVVLAKDALVGEKPWLTLADEKGLFVAEGFIPRSHYDALNVSLVSLQVRQMDEFGDTYQVDETVLHEFSDDVVISRSTGDGLRFTVEQRFRDGLPFKGALHLRLLLQRNDGKIEPSLLDFPLSYQA